MVSSPPTCSRSPGAIVAMKAASSAGREKWKSRLVI
jgi:hypothetical protein